MCGPASPANSEDAEVSTRTRDVPGHVREDDTRREKRLTIIKHGRSNATRKRGNYRQQDPVLCED